MDNEEEVETSVETEAINLEEAMKDLKVLQDRGNMDLSALPKIPQEEGSRETGTIAPASIETDLRILGLSVADPGENSPTETSSLSQSWSVLKYLNRHVIAWKGQIKSWHWMIQS